MQVEVDIRRFCEPDIPLLWEAARESITDLCAWMVWCHPKYSLADSRAFVSQCEAAWQKGDRYSFVIWDRRNGAFLGSVGLSHVDHKHRLANLGYWVRSSRTGCGIASAAVILAARFAFQRLDLNRLELLVPEANSASIRVAERVGAKREGFLRKRLVLEGEPRDALLYSLVEEDLRPRDAAELRVPFSKAQTNHVETSTTISA
jgi:RimJ/RimL family protein N-acetyltransferase